MPQDGWTLGFIARELNEKLAGGRVDKVTQPFKDMVLMNVRVPGETLRLAVSASPTYTRMHLTDRSYENPEQAPMFLMLMRKHVQGGRVLRVEQMFGDRLLRIDISASDEMGDEKIKSLYFEAMGRHTNLTLVSDGVIVDAVRHVSHDMSRVRVMLPGVPFQMPPRQDKLSGEHLTEENLYERMRGASGRLDKWLADNVSGFSMQTAREFAFRLTGREAPSLDETEDRRALAGRLSRLIEGLGSAPRPVLVVDENGVPIDALPFPFLTVQGEKTEETPTLSEAVDTLFYERDRLQRTQQRQQNLRRMMQNALSRCENRIAAQREELAKAEHMEEMRVAGELLTAFGHMVKKGAETADLPNYYDEDRPFTVRLDAGLSAAQNAQKYFKKYRKANVARRVAAEQILRAEKEKALVEDALFFIDGARTEAEAREVCRPLYDEGILKRPQADRRKKQKETKLKPLSFTLSDGTPVSVGRSGAQNEALLKAAQGSDWWLHAKDMPGSHVIVHTGGKKPSEQTVLEAARLAAYYSRGRGARVPVDAVERRMVKKPSGAPAGFVTFTGNRTLLVDAAESDVKALEAGKNK